MEPLFVFAVIWIIIAPFLWGARLRRIESLKGQEMSNFAMDARKLMVTKAAQALKLGIRSKEQTSRCPPGCSGN
jgi:hypothetical protein